MDQEYLPENQAAAPGLALSDTGIGYLRQTQKWAKFLGILGFVFTGLMVLAGLTMGSIMSAVSSEDLPIPGSLFSVLYIGFAVLYFFPSLYLYRYSTHLYNALHRHDSHALTEALSSEKSFFKFWGVLMVIMLVFYGLLIIGGIIIAMLR